MALASDVRLKANITPAGISSKGFNLYTWDWIEGHENLTAGLPGFGVLAQEVMITKPEAVILDDSGFFKVDYAKVM
jgi:hypothetical protein